MIDILARLQLDAEEFSRKYKGSFDAFEEEAEAAGARTGEKFGKSIGTKIGIGISAAAVGAIALIEKATSNAKQIEASARAAGLAAETYQELQYAAGQTGVEMEALGREASDLTKMIGEAVNGNRKAQQSFADLGISYETTGGKARPTIDVLRDLADRMAATEDPAQRAYDAAKLLGEGAEDIAPLLAKGADGMRQMAADANELGIVLSNEEIRSLNITAGKMQAFNNVMSAQISKIVADNADAIFTIAGAIGSAANQVSYFFRTMEGVKRIKQDEGFWSGFLSSMPEQDEAASAGGYVARRRRATAEKYDTLKEMKAKRDAARTPSARLYYERQMRPMVAELNRERQLLDKADAELRKQQAGARVTLEAGPELAPPTVDPKTPRATRAKAGPRDTSARDAERAAAAAKKQADAQRAAKEEIDAALASTERAIMLDGLRKDGLDDQALALERLIERERAIGSMREQLSEVLKPTTEELAKQLGISEEAARFEKDRADQAVRQAGAAVEARHAAEDMAAWRRQQRDLQEEVDRAQRDAARDAAEIQRDQFEDLADFYNDLFSGRTDDIWEDFQDRGMDAIAAIAAQWTLALLSGQKSSLGDIFTQMQGQGGGNPLGALLGSVTGGGGGRGPVFGGAGGSGSYTGNQTTQDMSGFGFGNVPGVGATDGDQAQVLGQSGWAGVAAVGAMSAISVLKDGSAKNIGGSIGATGGAAVGAYFGGPLGAQIGATVGKVLGELVGGLFTKTPYTAGTRVSSGGGDGNTSGPIGNVNDALRDIAEALGADLNTSKSDVSIGTYGGHYRVSTKGFTGKMKYEDVGKGVFNTGDDAEATVRLAIKEMIADGVLTGISDASQRILHGAGKDLDAAIEKAMQIESIPRLLRERLDPLGSALDDIDKRFATLAATLKEGGASAAQVAEARQLWQLERADAIKQVGEASATLKDFIKTLRIGGDSPLSLRTQMTDAEAVLAPFTAQIRAARDAQAAVAAMDATKAGGGAVDQAAYDAAVKVARAAAAGIDQEGYTDASSMLLSLDRQINGSTGAYFQRYDQIESLTRDAIQLIDRSVPKPGEAADPFSAAIADSTKATANILDTHTELLKQIVAKLGGGGDGGTNSFIGADRLFKLEGAR